MKKYVFIGILATLLSSCESTGLTEYQEAPRLNFAGEFTSVGFVSPVEFNDRDYLNGVMEKEDSLKVTLLGDVLESPLTYCFKVLPDTTTDLQSEPIFAEKYVFPAGKYTTWFKYKVKRPEKMGKKHLSLMVFDVDSPDFQFLPGLYEALQCTSEVLFRLEPIEGWNTRLWNATFLGTYSNGKYKFIIDTYKKTYKELTIDGQFRDQVREAYRAYRADGGEPIMDDSDTPKEIEFPA